MTLGPMIAPSPPTRVTDTVGVWLPCVVVSIALAVATRRAASTR